MGLVTDVLNWLQSLPQPALVGAAGLFAFAECTIGLGFLAPGEGAVLIAATTVDSVSRFLVLWGVITVCAALGDSIGYAIGRRFGPTLRESKLVRRHGANDWDRAADFLRRRGALAVYFGRFLPVIRTLIPAAAGASGLPYRKFAPAVIAGAASWSALHIFLGATLGQAARRVESSVSTGGLIIIGVAVAAFVVLLLMRRRRRTRAAHAAPTANDQEPDRAG